MYGTIKWFKKKREDLEQMKIIIVKNMRNVF